MCYTCFDSPSRKYFVSIDATFLKDRPLFLISLLQGKSVSEEVNGVIPLESNSSTSLTLSYLKSSQYCPTNKPSSFDNFL